MPVVGAREGGGEGVGEGLPGRDGALGEPRHAVHEGVGVHGEPVPVEGHSRGGQLVVHFHQHPVPPTNLMNE